MKFFAVMRTQSSAIFSNSGDTESRGQEVEPSETDAAKAVLEGAVAAGVVVAAVVVVLAKAVVAKTVVPEAVVAETVVVPKAAVAEAVAALGLLFDPTSPNTGVVLMLYDPRSLKNNPGTACDFFACVPKRFIATKVTSNKHNKQILSEHDLQQPSSPSLPTSDRFWESTGTSETGTGYHDISRPTKT